MRERTHFPNALLIFCALLAVALPMWGQTAAPSFEEANKLYEQGKYAEAAAAYEKLAPAHNGSPALYYNLGNAWFKAGQNGRAIAAYRKAEMLSPRDPSLRFNLNFVRKKVLGSDTLPTLGWRRWLMALTLNEWTALAMAAVWLWFLLLALRELRPSLRTGLRGYTATTGLAAVALAGCLALARHERSATREAVVTVPNAVVRYGPLEESKVSYQLPDGAEVRVLDETDLTVGGKKQSWLQVQDAGRRQGWLQSDQVILLGPPTHHPTAFTDASG
jgi:tetratricopeptide (TPR) repeat protein